jgi:hypothetical protein
MESPRCRKGFILAGGSSPRLYLRQIAADIHRGPCLKSGAGPTPHRKIQRPHRRRSAGANLPQADLSVSNATLPEASVNRDNNALAHES